MEYEQFFEKQNDKCEFEHQLIGFIFLASVFSLLLDCCISCRRNKQMKDLKKENETLKAFVMRGIDDSLVRMMTPRPTRWHWD